MNNFLFSDFDNEPNLPPDFKAGIGIIGCGQIVRSAHLPAYEKLGLRIAGVYDISPDAIAQITNNSRIENFYVQLDDLLNNPDITVVDIATHPAQRIDLIQQALFSRKHILAQKPLSPDVSSAANVIAEAHSQNLKLAVNQNGRWAPAWRIATLLIEQGAIGQVLSITHHYDVNFSWVTGTPFDEIPHWALYDYSVHWFDIIRCWMGDTPVEHVRARDYRLPHQPAESKANWGMWAEVGYENGANAMIRTTGGSPATKGRHPFWIHGTEGVIRGSVLGDDFLELETKHTVQSFKLRGNWFPDGFAGAMSELIHAVTENREPFNSARHNLLSLSMTLAACLSADRDGQPVTLEQIQ